MKHVYLVLFGFLSLLPAFIAGQSVANDIYIDTEKNLLAPYLKDLEEQGYCVIPEVLSSFEAKELYQRVWHEFIEKAWPQCRLDDRSNWKDTFPMHNKMGIFAGPAGQTQVMWDLRQDPRIVDIFAQIWNTNDLIVSMDGMSFMCPPEIREGYFQPWPHVDQAVLIGENTAHNNNPPADFVSESSLKTQPYTIQGQFLFEESSEGDGGFYCIPKSHLRFPEFAPTLEVISSMDIPSEERRNIRHAFIRDFFNNPSNESEIYSIKHVTAPRGSLILWDSRTLHWNQHAQDRPQNDNPKVRMVGYLCYLPKSRLTDQGRFFRKEAFEKGVSTGHNAAYPELKYTKNHIRQEFIQYLEDPNYVQPKIHLSPLGESLLGVESCD